jgi:outer membrane receptor protein involved in Fe transport
MSPEMNNDYVANLRNEKIVSAELGYAISNRWLRLNLSGYYYYIHDGNEWMPFFNDDSHSFTYNSLGGIKKEHCGVELGVRVLINQSFDIVALGTYNEAKYLQNTEVYWMNSNTTKINRDLCYNKGMRVGNTPLAAVSLALNYRIKRWYLNLTGNYYDRIYLEYSPNQRYESTLMIAEKYNPVTGEFIVPEQAKGDGGFMLNASIGRQFQVAHHPLSVNLQLCNLTNHRSITSYGYEQSRSNYNVKERLDDNNATIFQKDKERSYQFDKNPKKFFTQGFNFMLNLNYRF